MRVILEKTDLLKILSKEFGYDLEDGDVTVTAEPFEVQVSQLPVQHFAQKQASAPLTNVVEDPLEVPQYYEQESAEPVPVSIDELLARSEALAAGDKPSSGFANNEERLNRPLGPDEYVEQPPVSSEEIRGGLAALSRLAGGNQ
jgi:hypothetical protein